MSLGIFTHSAALLQPPHSPISPAVFLIIEDAIRTAWAKIRKMKADEFDLASADEDTITQKLHEVLMDDVYNSGQVDGFNSTLISKGTREEKIRNFNRQHLDKMPDMVFGIVGRDVFLHTQDGIFIECKPVDSDHTVVKHYCNKGIARFTRGEYAWCMLSSMMVGYAAPGYTVMPKLAGSLLLPLDEAFCYARTSTDR